MLRFHSLTKWVVTAESDPPCRLQLSVNGQAGAVLTPVIYDRSLNARPRLAHFFQAPLQSGDIVELRSLDLARVEQAKTVFIDRGSPIESLRAQMLSLPDWSIDAARVEGDTVSFYGWALASSNHAPVCVSANGQQVTSLRVIDREDVNRVFSSIRHISQPFAFTGTATVDVSEKFVKFELIEGNKSLLLNSYYFPLSVSKIPIPEKARRQRVYGSEDQGAFLRAGLTSFQRIMSILNRFFDRPHPCKILDWGCGCAGVGRYFSGDQEFVYTGVDIDFDNIEWCKANIPDGGFVPVAPLPPTNFAENEFDAVIGISVLTHLNERVQLAWLEELSRILRPHGVAVLTVLGCQALAREELSEDNSVISEGFSFYNDQSLIGDIIGDQDYYGTAFHTFDYVERRWARFFDIVAYIPAGLSHQDIVVLRKPGARR
jgi:SAM-dependent methyltransferase